jgi:hypothetical protein
VCDMWGICRRLLTTCVLCEICRRLLTYSHSQATQLQNIVGDKKPAVYLQVAGSGMLDSGYREASKTAPKPVAQDIWTLVVQCDAAKRAYWYRLVILSVSKAQNNGKAAKAPQVVEIDPYQDDGALLGSVASVIARDGTGCAVPKRRKGPGEGPGMRQLAALELPRVVELLLQRINLIKLQRQLDTHNLRWRAADGSVLLSLPCAPLQSRELRLRIQVVCFPASSHVSSRLLSCVSALAWPDASLLLCSRRKRMRPSWRADRRAGPLRCS